MNKRILLTIPLLTIVVLTTSCKRGAKAYQVNEKEYYEIIDQYKLLLNTNCTITFERQDMPYDIKLDNGKAFVGGVYFVSLTYNSDTDEVYYRLYFDNLSYEEQTIDFHSMSILLFGDCYSMFEIDYSSLTYNKDTKMYDFDNLTTDSFTIDEGQMQFYKNKIMYYEASIGNEIIKMTFSDYGKNKNNIPS